ncbi:MAG: GDP-mannose 4,6-dehydratase [Bacteriovoracaceae bacterium]
MSKRALITGITGQDGSYLAEHLLSLGYEVHGITRNSAIEDHGRLWRLQNILDKITLHTGSVESTPSLYRILTKIRPDECYHFAAQSFVSFNFEDEFSTMGTNVSGTHNLLAAIHQINPQCRFYFSGTSEMFGNTELFPQNETTAFHPRTVYGISKVVGFELTRNYRESYKMFACTGILYNHESPRRGMEFVTRKITSSAAKIKLGMQKDITLGNIDAERDWGYAPDYVRAMHLMLNYSKATDFVIGTGKLHTVRDFLDVAFGELGLKYQDHIKHDPKFNRPIGNKLVGNPQKAHDLLGWKPTIAFDQMVREMVRSDYDYYKAKI